MGQQEMKWPLTHSCRQVIILSNAFQGNVDCLILSELWEYVVWTLPSVEIISVVQTDKFLEVVQSEGSIWLGTSWKLMVFSLATTWICPTTIWQPIPFLGKIYDHTLKKYLAVFRRNLQNSFCEMRWILAFSYRYILADSSQEIWHYPSALILLHQFTPKQFNTIAV